MEIIDFKFDWNDSLKVGIEVVDQQHQELFRIVRKLEQAIITRCVHIDDEYLLSLLCELREYVTYHFYEEEKVIERLNPKALKYHKVQHDQFIKWVEEISYINIIKEPTIYLEKVRKKLESWCFEHVIMEDQKVFSKTS